MSEERTTYYLFPMHGHVRGESVIYKRREKRSVCNRARDDFESVSYGEGLGVCDSSDVRVWQLI